MGVLGKKCRYNAATTERLIRTRQIQVGCAYLALGGGLSGLAYLLPAAGYILLYPALTSVIIALSYATNRPVSRKTAAGISPRTWLLLAPWLCGQWCTWRWYAKRYPPFQEVCPGLYVGRRLVRREAEELVNQGVTAVLDLASEVAENPLLIALDYYHLPMSDLVPPRCNDLVRATDYIKAHRKTGKVYVHCKLGLSRSVSVAAAYLIRQGHAPAEALAMVSRIREGAAVSAATRQVLDLLPAQVGSEDSERHLDDNSALVKTNDLYQSSQTRVAHWRERAC